MKTNKIFNAISGLSKKKQIKILKKLVTELNKAVYKKRKIGKGVLYTCNKETTNQVSKIYKNFFDEVQKQGYQPTTDIKNPTPPSEE